MQGKRGWDQSLMASLFEKEGTYGAGKTHTANTSCSFYGFDFDPSYADKVVTDKDEITGLESGHDQEILVYGNNPTMKFARVRPNDFAGFASLVLGSSTPYRDAALAAYRHHIVPIGSTLALPSIAIVHKMAALQQEFRGVKGDSLKLYGSAGGFLQMDVGMIASGQRATNAAAFAAVITESWMKIDQLKVWLETGANISISSGASFDGNPLTTLAFVDGGVGADTLTDSANGFVADGFKPGMSVKITGATTSGNDVTAILTNVAAGTLTFATGTWAAAEAGKAGMTVVGTPTQGTEDISSATPDNLSIRGLSFEWTWNNNQFPQYGFGGAGYLQDILYKRRGSTLKIELQFEDETEAAYFNTQAVCAVELDFKAAGLIAAGGSMYYGAQVVIPRCKIKTYPYPKGGVDDLLSQTLEFEVFEESPNPQVVIEAYTAQAAYLATP
jgi:hypothetical protein